jgi:hypothetical protein
MEIHPPRRRGTPFPETRGPPPHPLHLKAKRIAAAPQPICRQAQWHAGSHLAALAVEASTGSPPLLDINHRRTRHPFYRNSRPTTTTHSTSRPNGSRQHLNPSVGKHGGSPIAIRPWNLPPDRDTALNKVQFSAKYFTKYLPFILKTC